MNARHMAVLTTFLLAIGCVVGDQLTTLTIHPDGTADLIVFRSNLHSTKTGAEATAELAQYKAAFDGKRGADFDDINRAGGTVVMSAWIAENAPMSSVVRAHLPGPNAIEQYLSTGGDDGGVSAETHLESTGSLRRLVMQVTMPPDKLADFPVASDRVNELRQSYANGISEMRMVVQGGAITSARGFIVAGDRTSALLDVSQITEDLRAGNGKAEFHLAWDLSAH